MTRDEFVALKKGDRVRVTSLRCPTATGKILFVLAICESNIGSFYGYFRGLYEADHLDFVYFFENEVERL